MMHLNKFHVSVILFILLYNLYYVITWFDLYNPVFLNIINLNLNMA